MKIHLCTPYFLSNNKERQAEFDACLQANIDNPHIDRITLFIDDNHEPPLAHPKVQIINIENRLTYRDWVEFALDAGDAHISVLSNTDIHFDDTVAQLTSVFNNRNRFVTLSRYEKIADGLEPHPNPKWSQDVWALRTDDEVSQAFLRDIDFGLGVPRCDNKIVYEAAIHGWNVINPFSDVRAIHLHESQVRSYHKTLDRTLIGGMGFAAPSASLSEPSKIELSVWPMATKNIANIRLITALEDWSAGAASNPAPQEEAKRVVAYNDEWQYPAITEKCAFDNITSNPRVIPTDCAYVGFPWATLIDKLVSRPAEAKSLLNEATQLKPALTERRRVVTVCQHIKLLRFQSLFADLGVTDIFWSHKVDGQDFLPDFPNIRLHAFPLYPVQVTQDEEYAVDGDRRRFLFSFVGARARDFYLTQSRTFILEELCDHPSGHVVGRDNWHYNKIVYDHQILGKADSAAGLVNDKASLEFTETLKLSDFSLCPSGSGPNSIRLWESIGAGSIPVILADTLDLPGARALWELGAVFCEETRQAVRALPDRLEAIASDPEQMRAKRHALKQLWMLYGPGNFVADIDEYFVSGRHNSPSADEPVLAMSDTELLEHAKKVLNNKGKHNEADFYLLLTASSRALLHPNKFLRLYNRHDILRKALNLAGQRCKGETSAQAWLRAQAHLKTFDDPGDRALCEPVLNIMLTGRNANRSPLSYACYDHLFSNRLQLVGNNSLADIIVFAASKNIDEENRLPDVKGLDKKCLAVLSEEPLWDTTWGFEFDNAHSTIRSQNSELGYAVLNHLTTDIFKFRKIPYFVTTEEHYAIRYTRLFHRNAALSPEDLLNLWREAPIRQAYFCEKRTGAQYDFERADIDLFGYCGFRTRLAEAAPEEGVLRVGQGWNATQRRQELPDWHLDKLATLDRRTFIASALENTHYPDYITEKPFDALATLAVPIYAANPNHRIFELVPETIMINVFGLDIDQASDKIQCFEPDLDFAARYLEAQKHLAQLFGSVETIWAERQRTVNETVKAFEALRNGEFDGIQRQSTQTKPAIAEQSPSP